MAKLLSSISFEVECISEEMCRNCEELEIGVDKTILYADDKDIGCANYLYCTHAQVCRKLLNRLEKVTDKQNEQRQEEI